jgi:tRNA(Ile)-lysidine synthase
VRRVELTFRRAADRLLAPGERLLVAVSGGGDSVALLHLLLRMRRGVPLDLHVAHLDHALRRGSAADRRFVERLAREHALPCRAERREVEVHRRRGESLEEGARRVRHRFLREAARAAGAVKILLGHTLDDQAETVLMRLSRGAGPAALGAMAERGPGRLVRPLLGLTRGDLRAFLTHHDLAWRDDPANADLAFDRNRVRRRVLPLLQRELNPRAAEHIVEAARRLREDALLLDELARERFAGLAAAKRGALVALDAVALAALPRALGGRVARLALDRAGIDGRRARTRHVDALLDLSAGPRGRGIDLPGGRSAHRRGNRLTIEEG